MLQAISQKIFFSRPISIESKYDIEESDRRLSHALRPYMDRIGVDGYVTVDGILISVRYGGGGKATDVVFEGRFVHRERRIFLEGLVRLGMSAKIMLFCIYAAFISLLAGAGSLPFEHGAVIAIGDVLVVLPLIAFVRFLVNSTQRSIRSAALQALQAGPAYDSGC